MLHLIKLRDVVPLVMSFPHVLLKPPRRDRLHVDERQIPVLHLVDPGKTRKGTDQEFHPEAPVSRHGIFGRDGENRFAGGHIAVVHIEHQPFSDGEGVIPDLSQRRGRSSIPALRPYRRVIGGTR